MRFVKDTLPNILGLWHDWAQFTIPRLDDGSAIDRWDGPWRRDVRSYQVDVARTKGLTAWSVPVELGRLSLFEGVVSGTPYNVVVEGGKTVKVLDLGSKKNKVSLLGSKFDTFKLPDPGVCRRSGDPAGGHDATADVLVVSESGDPIELWSMIQLNDAGLNLWAALAGTKFVCGWNTSGSRGTGRYRFDLTKAWKPGDGGTSGAGVPTFPMLLRWDEIERGQVNHCLFGIPANYAPEKTGWAAGTDGTWPGASLRAGDILRLTEPKLSEILTAHGSDSTVGIIATAMHRHGIFIGDKWTKGDPMGGPVKIKRSMDARWNTGAGNKGPLVSLDLRLTDFEALVV